MPPGSPLCIPHLSSAPAAYPSMANDAIAAHVAGHLIAGNIARPELWSAANRSATEFLRFVLEDWLDRPGRKRVERNFFLDIVLSHRMEPSDYDGDRTLPDPRRLFVTVHVDSAGYVVCGPTLQLLSNLHPLLPATFYRIFIASVETWVRVYDHRDALERVEQMREWIAQDADAEYEMPEVEKAIPAVVRKRPLSEKTVARLARECDHPDAAALLRTVLRLAEAAATGKRPTLSDDAYEQIGDCNPPVPALLTVFERHDAIEGCFDEEAQTMLEVTPEPNVIIPFSGVDPTSTLEGFRLLGCLTETLAAASDLIGRMPGNDSDESERE